MKRPCIFACNAKRDCAYRMEAPPDAIRFSAVYGQVDAIDEFSVLACQEGNNACDFLRLRSAPHGYPSQQPREGLWMAFKDGYGEVGQGLWLGIPR